VKSDVTDIERFHRHIKGLNAAIEIFVVHGILIVPDTSRRVGHFRAHKRDAIGSRNRFNLSHHGSRSCPSHDGGLCAHG
jgi:hypothetical protein